MYRIILTLWLCLPTGTAFAWTSWIGSLEDWPVLENAPQKEKSVSYESRVRPLFVKIDAQPWKAAPKPGEPDPAATLPRVFSWDVCFSGRGEGSVTAMMSDHVQTSATPAYALRAEDKAPWRTRRSLDYAGWIPEPVYKPIILSSSLNSSCRDPEKWKTGPGDKAKPQLSKMLEQLTVDLGRQDPKFALKESTARVTRAWASAKYGRFANVKVKTATDQNINAFFFLGESGPQFLGTDVQWIDAGDFDQDGTTEIILKQRIDKKDVYLLYQRGAKIVETAWAYAP